MCGRYALSTSAEALARLFLVRGGIHGRLLPRYNIAPTQEAPVIRILDKNEGRRMDVLRWGLVPHWADDPKIGNELINARVESAAATPAFRAAFRQRRCLVPADGFYEWQQRDNAKVKQPYFIPRRDRVPFAFAGLWESWWGQKGERLESFTILTTDANEAVKPIHTRMPVILAPADYDVWLDPAGKEDDVEGLQALLRPAPAEELTPYPVSRHVNSPRNDDPACVEKAGETMGDEANGETDGPSLFSSI